MVDRARTDRHGLRPLHVLTTGILASLAIGGIGYHESAEAAGELRDVGPAPVSVIQFIDEITDVQFTLPLDVRLTAGEPDAELGTPDLSRMHLVEDRSAVKTLIFPAGDFGICLLRLIQVGEDWHSIRTCDHSSNISRRGLAMQVKLIAADEPVPFEETVLLAPDGFDRIVAGELPFGTLENNFVVLPRSTRELASVVLQGPAGSLVVPLPVG